MLLVQLKKMNRIKERKELYTSLNNRIIFTDIQYYKIIRTKSTKPITNSARYYNFSKTVPYMHRGNSIG